MSRLRQVLIYLNTLSLGVITFYRRFVTLSVCLSVYMSVTKNTVSDNYTYFLIIPSGI